MNGKDAATHQLEREMHHAPGSFCQPQTIEGNIEDDKTYICDP